MSELGAKGPNGAFTLMLSLPRYTLPIQHSRSRVGNGT